MVYDMRPAPAVCPTILRCRVEAQGADHLPEEACGTVGCPTAAGDQPARRASAVAAGLCELRQQNTTVRTVVLLCGAGK